ncbi:hypothetical protein GX563_12755 [Candidatus Bathyarchaeota archaeon]|nr:hypothetical protein [Candidatus Bathyarchaeota archaeon]
MIDKTGSNLWMKLGFDIDGVIANFTDVLLQTIKQAYGLTLTEKDITSFSLSVVLGITRAEEARLITDILYKDLPIYPEAKETLERLSREGHSIYLLTGRYAPLRELTQTWLKDNGVPYDELHLLEMGKKYQANIEGLDVIVEDSLEEALEWSSRVKTVLVYDHPYNQSLNVKNLTKRVYSWNEIYLEISQLASNKPT